MSGAARVLIVKNPASEPGLGERLQRRGYEALFAADAEAALDHARASNPGIAIIEIDEGCENRNGDDSGALDVEGALDLISELKNISYNDEIKVILSSNNIGGNLRAHGLAKGVSGFLTRPYGDVQLFGRLRSLSRLITMRDELRRRAQTCEKYGIFDFSDKIDEDAGTPPRVLLLAPTAERAAALEISLSGAVQLAVVTSPAAALERLNTSELEALVIDADGRKEAFVGLCEDMRRNSRLFNLPVIVLAEGRADPDDMFARGVSDVASCAVSGEELAVRLSALVSQERSRVALQRKYRQARHVVTSDSLTGLYNFGFLMEHLRSEIDHAQRSGKTLGVALFKMKDMGRLNQQFGYAGGDRLLRQVGDMLGHLVRGEDLPARLDGAVFCIVFPDTPAAAMRAVAHRISDIVGFTDFAVPDLAEAVSVILSVGTASWREGDTPGSLLARAREDIDDNL
jgi:diguanylate cyclase (GGDEF)-like protein